MMKHAYLIMAHNDYPILIELLKALDDERNDILLHMDEKAKDVPFEAIRNAVRYARLVQVPRMDVAWGGYSQIECELRLLQEAKALGYHAYYHMMTGATYPVKTMDEIVDFFERHQGYEFIGFDHSRDFSNRVTRYHFFNEIGKVSTPVGRGKILFRSKLVGLQKKIHVFYKPAKNTIYKKGCVYWSLTDEAVTYVLHRTDEIRRIYKWSLCGDEVFMHTCLYNSPFREYIFDLEHEYDSCMRYIKPSVSWNSNFSGISSDSTGFEANTITKKDVDICLASGRLFALKFSGDRGLEAIRDIKARLAVRRQEEIQRARI